jgi:hypothetical protein
MEDTMTLNERIEYTKWVIQTETAYLKALIAQAKEYDAAAYYETMAITESMAEAA